MDINEFEQFLQEHEKDIFSFCRYLTMDNDKADDLYQDTVLHTFESIHKIDSAKNPKSFIFAVAVGKWKNMRRKVGRREKIAPSVSFEDFEKEPIGGDNPENHVQEKFRSECIRSVLSKMDDKFRIPIILFYFDDYDAETISNICKIPKGTVKSRLHKGRAMLKEMLIKEGFDYE